MLAKVPDLKSLFFLPFSRSTPRQRRDEDCFDVDLDNIHGKEFDFERNLALFDKKCVLEEIESNQPDVVRLIDHNRRGGTKTKTTTVSFTSFFFFGREINRYIHITFNYYIFYRQYFYISRALWLQQQPLQLPMLLWKRLIPKLLLIPSMAFF